MDLQGITLAMSEKMVAVIPEFKGMCLRISFLAFPADHFALYIWGLESLLDS